MPSASLFLLPLIAFVVLALVFAVRGGNRRRALEEASAAKVRTAAEEDVVRLGEDITSLDTDLAGRTLDEATRQDYRRALDSYDTAKQALDAVRRPEDVRPVTQALEDGRYAMACVKARVAGEPLPVRRPPCFFNPQHGPSVIDADWAPAGGAQRQVPVCAADADRLRAGAEPDTRTVMVDGYRRPYWDAGPAYAPWAQGYYAPYAMSGLLPGILMGAVLGGAFSGWDDPGTGAFDGGQGQDSGGFDGADPGGYDSGGYDSGGYDGGGFGGGDVGGGGDFGG